MVTTAIEHADGVHSIVVTLPSIIEARQLARYVREELDLTPRFRPHPEDERVSLVLVCPPRGGVAYSPAVLYLRDQLAARAAEIVSGAR